MQEWQAALDCYAEVLQREPGLAHAVVEREKLQAKMWAVSPGFGLAATACVVLVVWIFFPVRIPGIGGRRPGSSKKAKGASRSKKQK